MGSCYRPAHHYWEINGTRFDTQYDYRDARWLLYNNHTLQEVEQIFQERAGVDIAPSADVSGKNEGITVSGTLRYDPWDEYGADIDNAMHDVFVCLYDYNSQLGPDTPGGGAETLIKKLDENKTDACTYTNSTGYFFISNVNTTDTYVNDTSSIDLKIKFHTHSDSVLVQEIGVGAADDKDSYYTYLLENNLSEDYYKDFVVPSDFNQQFGAYDAIQDTINFFGVVDDYVLAKIFLPDHNFCDNGSYCYKFSLEIVIGELHDDASDRNAVIHETGGNYISE